MNWYLAVLQNYFGFGGRARRSEYWYFVLFNFLIMVALVIIDSLIDPQHNILAIIYFIALLIPGLAVTFRRLHDTDRSAWWLLIGLVPLIGPIVLIVFYCQEGTKGDNRFGPDPKAGA